MGIRKILFQRTSIPIFVGVLFGLFSCKKTITKDEIKLFENQYATLSNDVLEKVYRSDEKSSISYLDSIKKAYKVEPNTALDYIAECLRIKIYIYFGQTNSAAKVAGIVNQKLVKANNLDQYPFLYARLYFQLSDVNYKLKNFPSSFRYLYLGKKIGLDYRDEYILSEFYYRLAMIQYRQKDYLSAAKSFNTSFQKTQRLTTKNHEILYRQQETLDNIGLSYFKAGVLDSAEFYYQKALTFIGSKHPSFNKVTLNAAKGVVWGNLGQLYAAKKNYSLAINYLNKSIAVNRVNYIGNFDALLQSIQLGNVYLKTNKLDSAWLLIKGVETDLNRYNDLNAKADYYQLEASYFKKVGNLEQAFYFIELHNNVLKEIKSSDENLNKLNAEEQLQFIENDINFQLLADNSQSKSVFIFIIAVCLVFAIIILVLIFYNLKRSKKNIKALESLNQKINQQANELKVKNLEKDKILRVVAHDLRNPIGGINSIAKIMLMDELKESEKEMVELIDNTSQDALILINDILEFTNDNHNIESVDEKINVNTLINNTITLLKYRISEKKQEITFKGLKKDIWINGDREKLSRVFSNLINNSCKFSHANKTIEVKIELVQGMVVISVKDQGIGIQDEFKGGNIEALANNKRRGTGGEKSFGMGLSIAHQIVNKHDGKLWFVSSKEGTTFYVELPIIK